ncbi:MAG TPA: hypothetical protein VJP02_31510 [Candidatus Sulfotelmatobacter sp.]|nr:hypothetical protein [Candidatus Sulfotelmatobacter sp.]
MNRFTSQPDSSGVNNLPNQPERFVDAEKAAQYLSCSRKYLLKLSIHGKVPAHPLPGSGTRRTWRYLLSELHGWMVGNGGNHSAKTDGNRTINDGGSRKGGQ